MMRALLTAGLAAILLVGCSVEQADYDQRDGPAVADQIRLASSPVVQDVSYRPGDFMDAATISIILRPGVEDREAITFICAVVLPALSGADLPDSLGVDVLDDAWELSYSVDPAARSMSKGGDGYPTDCVS